MNWCKHDHKPLKMAFSKMHVIKPASTVSPTQADVFWIEIFPAMASTNINNSSTSSVYCVDPENIHEKIKQIVLVPLTILILVTNLVVLLCIAANKKFHTPTYMFIASLGFADIFVGLVSIVTLATKANERSYDLCLARIGCTVAAISASVWSLTCVAVDRYIAITRALVYKTVMTKRKVLLGIVWSWGISVVIGFVPLMGWKIDSYQCYCSFIYVLPKYYIIFLFITCAFIPLTSMIAIYAILLKNARFHIKRIQAIERLQDRRHSSMFGLSARNIRSIRTFVIVLGCVLVTWLPLMTSSLLYFFVVTNNCTFKEILGTHLLVLGFSNSFLNPLIYALGTNDFRSKVADFVCRRKCINSSGHISPYQE